MNPRLRQDQKAKEIGCSSITLQRYRKEINLLSPHGIPPSLKTNHTRKQKTSNTKLDDIKVTSNDLKAISSEHGKNKKSRLKGGAKIEFNEKNFDEIIHNNYF